MVTATTQPKDEQQVQETFGGKRGKVLETTIKE
jgi:hypothetical protein